jgi:hypothetical protein
MSKRQGLYLLFALIMVVISLTVYKNYFFQNEQNLLKSQTDFSTEAKKIVGICTQEEKRDACYDREIPLLMDRGFSMEDAFEVTIIVQQLDRSYQYCHVLGHYLSAKETAKDPEKWKDVVARAPLGVCSNGAVHGAFQERFRTESMIDRSLDEIEAELDGVCEPREGWQPTRMGQATCVHALGHLTMYVTEANINDSLALCSRLFPEPERDGVQQLCFDGAFMQIYQPLEPEDFALIEGKEIKSIEESKKFCTNFEGQARGSCISESWPLYRSSLDNPETLPTICDQANFDSWQHERCMSGVFYVSMAQANLSVEWASDFCPKMTKDYRGMCFGNSASRLIEVDSRNIDKAISLCEFADTVGSGKDCFNELLKYSGYTFLVGSPEFYELCEGLPDDLSQQCLKQRPVEKI